MSYVPRKGEHVTNMEHVRMVGKGAAALSVWLKGNPGPLDLRYADFTEARLGNVDLSGANLHGAVLSGADLTRASLACANLRTANLTRANLRGATFEEADLRDANLEHASARNATLRGADLRGANLSVADLRGADLERADLRNTVLFDTVFASGKLESAEFAGAELSGTVFSQCDLTGVIGLDDCLHFGHSCVDFLTQSSLPEEARSAFLLGCGLPVSYLNNVGSLISSQTPLELNSCFISYTELDSDFAERLYAGLRKNGVTVWFAPKDLRGGRHIRTEVDRAIQLHDKLLVVLSKNSINSEWVKREVKKALAKQESSGVLALFPIALDPYEEVLKNWQCVDTETGDDLAVEVRKYYIPPFGRSDSEGDFADSLQLLLDSLKQEKPPAASKFLKK